MCLNAQEQAFRKLDPSKFNFVTSIKIRLSNPSTSNGQPKKKAVSFQLEDHRPLIKRFWVAWLTQSGKKTTFTFIAEIIWKPTFGTQPIKAMPDTAMPSTLTQFWVEGTCFLWFSRECFSGQMSMMFPNSTTLKSMSSWTTQNTASNTSKTSTTGSNKWSNHSWVRKMSMISTDWSHWYHRRFKKWWRKKPVWSSPQTTEEQNLNRWLSTWSSVGTVWKKLRLNKANLVESNNSDGKSCQWRKSRTCSPSHKTFWLLTDTTEITRTFSTCTS